MTHQEFDRLLKERLAKIEKVLASKAGEYASREDRLHNFKKAGDFARCTSAQACLAFMTKHLVSVVDIVGQVSRPSHEVIDEKIGDAINYLILLEALLKEGPA